MPSQPTLSGTLPILWYRNTDTLQRGVRRHDVTRRGQPRFTPSSWRSLGTQNPLHLVAGDGRQLLAHLHMFERPRPWGVNARAVAEQHEPDERPVLPFEHHFGADAEIGQRAAQDQPPLQQAPGSERLAQHQQRLDHAALAHPVQAAQQVQWRARQIEALEALEVEQADPPQHQTIASGRSRISQTLQGWRRRPSPRSPATPFLGNTNGRKPPCGLTSSPKPGGHRATSGRRAAAGSADRRACRPRAP